MQIICNLYNTLKTSKTFLNLKKKVKNKRCKRKICQSYGLYNLKHQEFTLATKTNAIKILSKNNRDWFKNQY